MEKLDLKDRKILYHLDFDSRQSFRSIGKKVGLSKDVVTSRVKKLQEKGIIKNFYTNIDTFKLGYTFLRFYIVFQYITPEIRQEITDYFIKNKYSMAVNSTEGTYDLTIYMAVKKIQEFYSFWSITLKKYRNYFAKQIFSIFIKSNMYPSSFLLDEKDNEKLNRQMIRELGGTTKIDIDDLDYKILNLITQKARIPTIEIAKKLEVTTNTISNRINTPNVNTIVLRVNDIVAYLEVIHLEI